MSAPRKAPRRRTAEKAGARISEHRLDNGLRVLIAERHTDPVVAVMTWYQVGARNESEREAGYSHFLEHLMFKGAQRFGRGEVDRLTTVLGGSNNAFTSYDHTAYWFELASDRWEHALEMEADRMRGLTLDPVEFDSERAVVLEELSMGLDDPWRALSESVQAALFERHPYRRPIIGHPDSLAAATVGDLRAYYDRFYHPANALIVLAGDVRKRDALARVRSHFGGIPAGTPVAAADCFRGELAEPRGEKRVRMSWDDRAQRLCIAWPTVPVGTDDDFRLDLVSTVLASGRLSRLHRRLVLDRGLATSVSTSNDTRVESGVFWLFAEAAQGVAAEELERAVDAELSELARDLVAPAELRRAKKILASSEHYDAETASDLAEQLGEYAVDADWRLCIDGQGRLAAVTRSQLRDAARRLLAPDRRVVGWSLPAEVADAWPAVRPAAGRRRTQARSRKGARAARGRGGSGARTRGSR